MIAQTDRPTHDIVWDQAAADQLTKLCLDTFTTGLRHADQLTLDHEAERVEAMRPSPLVLQMRAAVDVERARRTDLAEVLSTLPDRADAIAALLLDNGCLGRRNDPESCPLAVYLKLRGVANPTVARRHASADDGERVDLPNAAVFFVSMFDFGVYPELAV